jgi:hypothetical protein
MTPMIYDRLNSIVCRVFFGLAFVIVALGALEKVVNLTGYTILRSYSYTPRRLFEFAAILCIIVIALLLRQVREQLKRNK